jgi:hypothetical protein
LVIFTDLRFAAPRAREPVAEPETTRAARAEQEITAAIVL